MMEHSKHVEMLLDRVENDNKLRKYHRRSSARRLLSKAEPIVITIYTQSASRKFGFSMRGGGERMLVHTPTKNNCKGQYVRSVDLDSPADQAGLKAGDRIIVVNETPCEGQSHEFVRDLIKSSDTPLKLLVLRDEKLGEEAKKQTFNMVLAESREIIDDSTGNPVLTAEMKGCRLGRTRKIVTRLSCSEDFSDEDSRASSTRTSTRASMRTSFRMAPISEGGDEETGEVESVEDRESDEDSVSQGEDEYDNVDGLEHSVDSAHDDEIFGFDEL